VCTQKQLVTRARQKYWGKFVDIPDLRLGPPRLAFGTPRGSRNPRLRTTVLAVLKGPTSKGRGGDRRSTCLPPRFDSPGYGPGLHRRCICFLVYCNHVIFHSRKILFVFMHNSTIPKQHLSDVTSYWQVSWLDFWTQYSSSGTSYIFRYMNYHNDPC